MITLWTIDPTPTPLPAFDGDPNIVTPGVIGFGATFLIAIVTVFLVMDMVRRVRRIRYRDEVRAELEAEQAAESKNRDA
ncbi:hypothetical protein M2152_000518 [Microbacteriaceae bacterium SG_E_30_P1]|uniref:Heme exporter protein D n=1 Tax=Antiquaquibacter oligotrophicus TaxID=2880260 RepID=A0ABT6KK36_9MICO|nr:hypothetical protein [Antiquaquibacter oligotrophicus]MDH6180336.1 hypothetical protein [Antiquaquibacter oligotrophicus]UDF13919.1 hypothetical protein LH407_03425 [Antiquaquibacter oligotrophicus]